MRRDEQAWKIGADKQPADKCDHGRRENRIGVDDVDGCEVTGPSQYKHTTEATAIRTGTLLSGKEVKRFSDDFLQFFDRVVIVKKSVSTTQFGASSCFLCRFLCSDVSGFSRCLDSVCS